MPKFTEHDKQPSPGPAAAPSVARPVAPAVVGGPGTNPHYARIGGAQAVRRLVERFYGHMDTLPQARGLRALHPADLSGSKEKLFMFLSGWLGGPPLYAERVGPPRLGTSHRPFAIDKATRDIWMACMMLALESEVPDAELRGQLEAAFRKTADHLRNR